MARFISLSGTGRQAAGSVRDLWNEYKGWLVLALILYLLYSLRGAFAAISTAATAGAEAVTGGITKAATVAVDKKKAQAASGGKVTYTDEQVATFRADAQALASYFGRGSASILEQVFKNTDSAFSLLKQKYSRLNLYKNLPWKYVSLNGKKAIQVQQAETADSVQNKTNWRVLAPFYLEASGGHSLEVDARFYLTSTTQKAMLKWIL